MKQMFNQQILIYVPAYNCARYLVSTLSKIPQELTQIADIVVIDNCSNDGTSEAVLQAQSDGTLPFDLTVIRTDSNLGYAGSQKLAYTLAIDNPTVRWVIMLHGDGQYAPELMRLYQPYFDSNCAAVYGHRSKAVYGQVEETPLRVWVVIKALSILESLVTGIWRHEWHTGFTMYATDFLRELDLNALTHTPHIDGHLLYAAGALKKPVGAVPIYKLYKELTPFEGHERRQYVIDVLTLMFKFRRMPVRRTNKSEPFEASFKVVTDPSQRKAPTDMGVVIEG